MNEFRRAIGRWALIGLMLGPLVDASLSRAQGPAAPSVIPMPGLKAGDTYRVHAALTANPPGPEDRATVVIQGPGGERIAKVLHAGDPDVYVHLRPLADGDGAIVIEGEMPDKVRGGWSRLALTPLETTAIEAEPNDHWQQANRLVLGRDVYGSADDVDYLDNPDEGKAGLDWFRFDVPEGPPVLVYFQLDVLDRDVPVNLRVHTIDDQGEARPYLDGKDPMEVIHDRERERYSKHISRTFGPGTYYLEVNANHPSYVLRTRVLPVPPYDDPAHAVEAGAHYVMNVGDAWFAQTPREGHAYTRAASIHDTAMRCTACHASSFSTEAVLTAHRNGYPIRSKDAFQYVIDRLDNSITPLYGGDGLYWQRFIAIPLQSQGKQGSILLDYERQVGGPKSTRAERFGPFLREAWAGRNTLPDDEVNGVVPLDSKFGLAWRAWRVLNDLDDRDDGAALRQAAETIERLLADDRADARVETLQDRIHRLHAWSLIDRAGFADRIAVETASLLALQNDDGGWHELDAKSGPSAVYTTGQLAYTLMESGLPPNHPALARAFRYLLAQQRPFGGWFQGSTHENFRTPMRETRYAVMALARAFPASDGQALSWGNRDEGQARPPRTESVVRILDGLENLWDVPEAERLPLTDAILPLLDHQEPLVRAQAAACLGRLGHRIAVEPLIERLADPSKVVWRAAAWALRRLGNQGAGIDAIAEALDSPDAATRRGATRIFAYQFPGMDHRKDLALRLIQRTDDPDLWTRLQALKTLRHWFYRTGDATLQRRIVYAYLARMGRAEHPAVRRNLAEGLYIMLDENLGGGVSLQKNIAQLPERLRGPILAARAEVERSVLLGPVLSALSTGNDLQREAILAGFDGSFFQGRGFARRPTGMIDVGNDREFGFLYEPDASVLDRTFEALFLAENRPSVRHQAIRLAAFFDVTSRTTSQAIQAALLRALSDNDPTVREAARSAVASGLALGGIEDDPGRIAMIEHVLTQGGDGQAALVQALARRPDLIARPSLLLPLREALDHEGSTARLAPVLGLAGFEDREVVEAVRRDWGPASPASRLALLDVLATRRALLDVEEPSEAVVALLQGGVNDASSLVRERALTVLGGVDRLLKGPASTRLVLSALADDSPPLRRLALGLGSKKPGFWDRPDAREHLIRLLVGPDLGVRGEALKVVERDKQLAASPPIASRLKAPLTDNVLRERALAALAAAGVDPDSVVADVSLARPRLLSLTTFRQSVSPLFYAPSADGYACADCHGNHTVLRIADAEPGQPLSSEQLLLNYASALKVVNLGDPESSLLVRKPRSPQGQGGPDPDSATGLTHVGGPRWEGPDHPSYQAILDWLREPGQVADSVHLTADSYAPGYEPALASDGDLGTLWHTEFVGARPGYPHDIVLDLGESKRVENLLYVPRQDSPNGRVKAYEVRLSVDGEAWSEPVAQGEWPDEPSFQLVPLKGQVARFVQLRGLSEVGGRPVMSAAELAVDAAPLVGAGLPNPVLNVR